PVVTAETLAEMTDGDALDSRKVYVGNVEGFDAFVKRQNDGYWDFEVERRENLYKTLEYGMERTAEYVQRKVREKLGIKR
ncbi:MAG: hypothetical protein RMM53_13850, partial [Bacteroidia bacterium]|nr:hypothetical protein [Bacteroidia bacterium]